MTPQEISMSVKMVTQIAPSLATTVRAVMWVSVQASFNKGYISHPKWSMTVGPQNGRL